MRLSLTSCGDELGTVDADPAWQIHDVLATLPGRFRPTMYSDVRVFFGTVELCGESTLSDIGAHDAAMLMVVQSKLILSLTVSQDGSARIWSTASGECLHTLTGHGHEVISAVFSPDAERALTASCDGSAKIWSTASGACLHTLTGHGREVISAVFSPDAERALTASCDRSAKIWSTASGACLHTLTGHGRRVMSAVFSPER